jgi:hypothetical protein
MEIVTSARPDVDGLSWEIYPAIQIVIILIVDMMMETVKLVPRIVIFIN